MTGLAHAGIRAFKWSSVSTAGRFGLQLIAQIVLARLLGPENFGIFGIGMVVYTFSNFLVGFGFGWSLLQRASINNDDIRFAFTWQVIAGCIAMVALYFSAPFLAVYFRDARVQPVIEWMSLACLINATTSPASNLLQRDLNFKAVGLIQVASYACGYIAVGIPMALMGHGVSSLVAAWLTQAAVAMLAMYAIKRHPVRPLFWYSGARTAFGTGGTVFVTNIVNWSLNNLDRVFIGRMLNVQAVGLYTAGYNIAIMPNTLLLSALQPAFMATTAKMQSDTQRLGRVYLQMLATISVLVLPFFVFLALVAPDLVHVLYGPKWAQTADVMTILFLGMPAYVTWGISTPILWNTGHKQFEFLLQLPSLVLGAIGFYLFTDHGIYAAAIVASLVLISRGVAVGAFALRSVGVSPTDLLPHIARGLSLSALAAGCSIYGHFVTSPVSMPVISLAVIGSLTVFVVTILVAVRPMFLGETTIELLVRIIPAMSPIFKRTHIPR